MGGRRKDPSGLNRALCKAVNRSVAAIRRTYVDEKRNLNRSVLEFLESDDHPRPVNLVNSGSSSTSGEMTVEEPREQQRIEEDLHTSSVHVQPRILHTSSVPVPRRPPLNSQMSFEDLNANEEEAFLVWRRNLARLEENEKLVLTPFEKKLDIWRQLWRVVERSDLVVMVVDARDPLFYRCPDLEAYVEEIDEHKRTLLLVNKADLLPCSVRDNWAEYFRSHRILFVFWSAKAAAAALEGKSTGISGDQQESTNPDTKIYARGELLSRLQSEAEGIVAFRNHSGAAKSVMVGFVGYPNVGKSSTINALVGKTSTPGKTKHFQTHMISDKLTLCDCPGLVFPSFTSSRFETIASGVLSIHRMTQHREAVQVVADRVPRQAIELVYNISLPKPKCRPPSVSELLEAYRASRRLPDETKASRQILKDYVDGKLPHFELPPGCHWLIWWKKLEPSRLMKMTNPILQIMTVAIS